MFKKTCCMFLVLILVFCFSGLVFAVPTADTDAEGGNMDGTAVSDPASTEGEPVSETEHAEKSPMDEIMESADVAATEQFLVTITRPVGDETTFKKTFVICGVTEESDVRVALAVKDEESGKYSYLKNTEGNSSWDIGSIGIFTKEINLAEGTNSIKIAAYKKGESGELKPGENLQISYYTITVLKESIRQKIENGLRMLTDKIITDKIFEGIF